MFIAMKQLRQAPVERHPFYRSIPSRAAFVVSILRVSVRPDLEGLSHFKKSPDLIGKLRIQSPIQVRIHPPFSWSMRVHNRAMPRREPIYHARREIRRFHRPGTERDNPQEKLTNLDQDSTKSIGGNDHAKASYEQMNLLIKMKRGILISMAAVICSLFCGCESTDVGGAAAAATGTRSATYDGGELRSQENVTFGQGWNATLAQVKEMQSGVEDQWRNEVSAQVVFRDLANNKIEIKLTAAKEGSTTFRIRVESSGDQIYSQEILSKIRKRF